jgi:hypothetical protein
MRGPERLPPSLGIIDEVNPLGLKAGLFKHLEQLNRFRFRHKPLESLASLEMRWEQTTGTGVLPP